MDPEIQKHIQELKSEALKYYQQKQYDKSLQFWQHILAMDPQNSLAMLYLRRLQHDMQASQSQSPPVAQKEKEVITKSIKVMVVDDSAMMRKAIVRIFSQRQGIEVVDAAKGGEEALQNIPTKNPDVVTLDVNMPGMDGITTLKHIMVHHPRPVIMLSAFTEEGSTATFDCLSYGAVDFICKPSKGLENAKQQEEEICQKVINASNVQVCPPKKARALKKTADEPLSLKKNADWVLAIGAGEGGYHSYLKIIPHLPAKLPCAVLAVLYAQEKHLDAFCTYLNHASRIMVKKAEQGEVIKEGVCYFMHDANYLKIDTASDGHRCQITPRPALISQQNVINQLFFSVGEKYGANSVGVLLTAKGVDGVEGFQELKRMNSTTLVQDPRTCLMPQAVTAAMQARCVDQVVKDVDLTAMVWHILKSKGVAT